MGSRHDEPSRRHSSAAQLDKLVRGVHRARTHEQADRDPEQAVWQLRTCTRYDEHGNFVLTIRGPAQLLLLPPASLRTVLKTLPGRGGPLRLRPVSDTDLRRFDLGRTRRQASPALRELLGALDGQRCRFPGCTRHRKLHAHHVRFWRDGGRTDLDNLILVCSRHHTVLHVHGFQLVLHPDRRLEVHTADGVPVLHHPAQPWGDPTAIAASCGRLVSAETLAADHCDARLDLHYAISVLMAQAC